MSTQNHLACKSCI